MYKEILKIEHFLLIYAMISTLNRCLKESKESKNQ